MNRSASQALIAAAYVLGLGSLVVFLAFLAWGSFGAVPLGLAPNEALIVDAGLCVLFFAQHSLMIRQGFRARLAVVVSEDAHGAIYAVASGLALLAVIVLWQPVPGALVEAGGPLTWGLRALFVLGLAGFTWGMRSLGTFDPFGVKRLRRSQRGRETTPGPLVEKGAYRWVRHPLYLAMLLLIWSCPTLTADRLLFDLLWTAWIVVGARLEERDLLREFGEPYRAYQARVPMILPVRVPRSQAHRPRDGG